MNQICFQRMLRIKRFGKEILEIGLVTTTCELTIKYIIYKLLVHNIIYAG